VVHRELFPRVGHALLHAQRDAAAVLVDVHKVETLFVSLTYKLDPSVYNRYPVTPAVGVNSIKGDPIPGLVKTSFPS
jgi:hypothetical protein